MIVHLRLSAQIKEEQDSDNHEITDACLWGWTVYFECEDVWCYWDSNPALSVRVWMQLRPTSLQGSRFRVLTGSQPGMSPRRRHWLTGVLAFCMLSLLSCDLEFLMKYFWVQSVLWWFNWEVRQICSSLLHPRGGDEQERCDPSGGHWTSVFSYLSQSSHSLNFGIIGN